MAISIRRRELVLALGGVAAAWPFATRAQQRAYQLSQLRRNTGLTQAQVAAVMGVSQACNTVTTQYTTNRAAMLDKYNSTPCKIDTDCRLVFEGNACVTNCGVALPISTASFFESNIAGLAMACNASCPALPPPEDEVAQPDEIPPPDDMQAGEEPPLFINLVWADYGRMATEIATAHAARR